MHLQCGFVVPFLLDSRTFENVYVQMQWIYAHIMTWTDRGMFACECLCVIVCDKV